VQSVSFISCAGKIEWKQSEEGQTITMPAKAPNKLAVEFETETE